MFNLWLDAVNGVLYTKHYPSGRIPDTTYIFSTVTAVP